ncbi:MAG: amidase [Burkholderiales bacterium]|nr:amidase [Burkholderiales bacterium]
MKRRRLLLTSAATALLRAPAMAVRQTAAAASPAQADATTLARRMAEGRLSSERIVASCLARIQALDRAGPRLNSIIELNPEATALARALDAERRAGRVRGPLHGVPVLLKDNIATGDRMATSAGSLALAGVRATRDAHLVKRLREAGALILGKTNLSEWANIRSTRSTSGWSARGGLTRNPYALDRSTSGSSSGTAAAIAASLAPLGVGTETDGSIVSPASICGLVGLKPTVGRISRDGIIPISATQDSAGPMCRSVADAALLYAAMAGPDAADAATASAPADGAALLPRFAPDALKGVRLGVARNFLTGFDEADALFNTAVQQLRALGAEVVDDVGLPGAGAYWDAELTVLLVELRAGLEKWLASFAPGAPVKNLADLIAFNLRERPREMPHFGQELFEKAMTLGGLDSAAYQEALAACVRGARTEGLDKAFDTHRVDAIIAPTGGLAWLIDYVAGDHYGASFSTPAAVAGYPHLTVPCGLVRGLPLGLSFVGRPWTEARLLAYGHAYEQAAQARRAPRLTPRTTPG